MLFLLWEYATSTAALNLMNLMNPVCRRHIIKKNMSNAFFNSKHRQFHFIGTTFFITF